MQQRDLVHAGDLRRVGDPVPELERALEQRRGLAEGVDGLGGLRGADTRSERGALVARRRIVVGDAGGELRAGGPRRGAALERLGEGAVKLGPLAGEQVVGDDLAEQRVAEGVAVVGLRDDQVARDGLAQRADERGAVHAADVGERRVVDLLADGEDAQELLRRLAELLDADHQGVAERDRQRAAAVHAGGEQLLHEERVALAARVEALEQVAGGRLAEDVLEGGGELGAAQRLDRDPPHRGVALDLGEQGAQRVAAVQLVDAVREDREHALAAERAREEGDERPRGRVGPVEVLEREDDGRVRADAVEQREDRLEQAALRGPVGAVVRRRRAGQPGEEPGELGAVARMERVEGGMAVAGERAKRRHQRGVGHLALAELDGVAAQDLRAGRLGAPEQLVDEAGLADPRVTRYEGERRSAGAGVPQRVLELLQLGRAPDHPAAGDPRRHGTSMARATPDPRRCRRRGRALGRGG